VLGAAQAPPHINIYIYIYLYYIYTYIYIYIAAISNCLFFLCNLKINYMTKLQKLAIILELGLVTNRGKCEGATEKCIGPSPNYALSNYKYHDHINDATKCLYLLMENNGGHLFVSGQKLDSPEKGFVKYRYLKKHLFLFYQFLINRSCISFSR
jgi:hypothetical protein